MIVGPHLTASGLSILDLNQLMADRVAIWADKRHRERLARDERLARAERLTRTVAAVAAAKIRTTDGVRAPWTARHRVRR